MCDTVYVFDDPETSKDEVAKTGEAFLLSLYGADKTQTLDKYRYYVNSRKKILNLCFSPPHYHQQVLQLVCTRLGCSSKCNIAMVIISLQSNRDERVAEPN